MHMFLDSLEDASYEFTMKIEKIEYRVGIMYFHLKGLSPSEIHEYMVRILTDMHMHMHMPEANARE